MAPSKAELEREADADEEEILALEAALKLNEELKRIEAEMRDRSEADAPGADAGPALPSDPPLYRDVSPHMRPISGRQVSPGAAPARKKKETFTAAPESMRQAPAKMRRDDYSHSDYRLKDISHQNQILAEKLHHIHLRAEKDKREYERSYVPQHLKAASVAPAAINRKKKMTKIEQENHRLFQRLQAVKGTPGLSNKNLASEHKKQQQHAALISKQPKPRLAERPPWNDR